MKKLVACMLGVFMLTASLSAMAGPSPGFDDLSWWGQSGATPDPVADTKGRSGYWWWPTEPASNSGDSELWGNRGVVYYCCYEPAPPAPPVAPPGPAVPKVERQIPVLNDVLFDFDKSVLKPEGKTVVDQVVAEMSKYPKDTVVVEGHTCDIGTDEYNMGLGQRRADSVKNYMVQSGIDSGRVSTVSYGESQPAVPNTSPANRKLNRRAVFKYTIGQ